MSDMDSRLQEHLAALEEGRSLDSILAGMANEERVELEGLLRLAAAVRSIPHPTPAVAFADRQRARIYAAVEARTRPFPIPVLRAPALPRLRFPRLGGAMAFSAAGLATLCLGLALLFSLGLIVGGQNNQTARLENVVGQVQVASNAGATNWKNVGEGYQVREGQHLRTLGASGVTLTFYDGSRTIVGPNAQLSFTRLEKAPDSGLRVEINQVQGQTAHAVVPFSNERSLFAIDTPAGKASVHGTSFNVQVADSGAAQFSVNTGEVRVTGAEQEVTLMAGQATAAEPGQPPADPAYVFNLQGSLIDNEGGTWAVSGVTFTITETTVLGGGLDLGNTVQVTGRVLADGARVADSILHVSSSDQAAYFTGVLESMEGKTWLVSGVPVVVNDDTVVADNVARDDPVKVSFNILDDQRWLALRIESLAEEPAPAPSSTPDLSAQPSLDFTPDELEETSCGNTDFTLTGTLVNTGDIADDYAANVRLSYLIERGGEYINSVELTPLSWDRIEGGASESFAIHVTLDPDWAGLEEGEVKLRVFVAAETNRPDHHRGRVTVTIIAGCRQTPTPSATEQTGTPTLTFTPTVTGTLTTTNVATANVATATSTATPTTGTLTPQDEDWNCTGADPHPTGMTLAQRYGVPYEEIMSWFCRHYGFGEIDLAYSLSRASGKPVEQVFAMRASGMGWGKIKQDLAPDNEKNGKDDGGDDDDGRPDKKDKLPKKTPKPKKP